MRCVSCNSNLNDYESTLRSKATGDFLDLCKGCLKGLNIKTMPNQNDPDDASPNGDEHYWDFPEITGDMYDPEDSL